MRAGLLASMKVNPHRTQWGAEPGGVLPAYAGLDANDDGNTVSLNTVSKTTYYLGNRNAGSRSGAFSGSQNAMTTHGTVAGLLDCRGDFLALRTGLLRMPAPWPGLPECKAGSSPES